MTMPTSGRTVLLAVWLTCAPAAVQAQSADAIANEDAAAAVTRPSWSFDITALTYVFPNHDNYVQPTITADRGALHLETRYNYEDRNSLSAFIGWNFDFGEKVTLELTPMLGGLVGDTNGLIPALEFDFAWRWLEIYSEGEFVIDPGDRANNYLYNWSQVSIRPVTWLQAGLTTQRTRAYQTPRDIQLGPFVGVTVSKVTGTVYFFNPGSTDHFVVAALGVSF
jgi:hypothetical protein